MTLKVGDRVRYRSGAPLPTSETGKRGVLIELYKVPASPLRAKVRWDGEERVAEGIEAHQLVTDK